MLKKFGQRPGVQRTFWFSSRTPPYKSYSSMFIVYYLTKLLHMNV